MSSNNQDDHDTPLSQSSKGREPQDSRSRRQRDVPRFLRDRYKRKDSNGTTIQAAAHVSSSPSGKRVKLSFTEKKIRMTFKKESKKKEQDVMSPEENSSDEEAVEVEAANNHVAERAVNIQKTEMLEFVMEIDVGHGIVFPCTLYEGSDFHTVAEEFCVTHGIPLRKQDGIAQVMKSCIADYFTKETSEKITVSVKDKLSLPTESQQILSNSKSNLSAKTPLKRGMNDTDIVDGLEVIMKNDAKRGEKTIDRPFQVLSVKQFMNPYPHVLLEIDFLDGLLSDVVKINAKHDAMAITRMCQKLCYKKGLSKKVGFQLKTVFGKYLRPIKRKMNERANSRTHLLRAEDIIDPKVSLTKEVAIKVGRGITEQEVVQGAKDDMEGGKPIKEEQCNGEFFDFLSEELQKVQALSLLDQQELQEPGVPVVSLPDCQEVNEDKVSFPEQEQRMNDHKMMRNDNEDTQEEERLNEERRINGEFVDFLADLEQQRRICEYNQRKKVYRPRRRI